MPTQDLVDEGRCAHEEIGEARCVRQQATDLDERFLFVAAGSLVPQCKVAVDLACWKLIGSPWARNASTRRAVAIAKAAGWSSGVRTSANTSSKPIATAVAWVSCNPWVSSGLPITTEARNQASGD